MTGSLYTAQNSSECFGQDESSQSSFWSSDSFDQHHSLAGLGFLGTVVRVFGVVGTRAAQVQKAEARLQAEALLCARSGAGGGGDVVVVVGCRSVVQIALCTLGPVTSLQVTFW